ncbi:MAG: NUDIX domain-containing protein [Clostridiales bacterium]|nr:NUDIX domain-containing protein [Clostridiales bacterium]
MRLLFELDRKDYSDCTTVFVRDSARSIILRDGKIAMIHSLKYDYFKFPGGGIKEGESPVDAMIRETREESGLVVDPNSVREYGYVHRIQKSDINPHECFIQDNYYYLCDAYECMSSQQLDEYEAEEGYVLEYTAPKTAIKKNTASDISRYKIILEREARVIEPLISENIV